MNNVTIIGAGQIGSRHLQALKRVKVPLSITVVDPSERSLKIAKKRYEEMPKGKHNHKIKYLTEISTGQNIDLVIVATTSDIRAKIIKNVLKNNKACYLILEKILFDKKSDYYFTEKMLSNLRIKAWVNCPRRVTPVYQKIKEELSDKAIFLRAIGSQWGLACNAVHILDLASYITEDYNYAIDTHHLDKKISPSRRKGFLEVNGTLYADFTKESHCELTSHTSGNAPFILEIFNKDSRYIIRESEGKYWTSNSKNNWKWEEVLFKPLLISETTTLAVENILKNGDCPLTPYEESIKIHLPLLEALKRFLNNNSNKKYDHYPFT